MHDKNIPAVEYCPVARSLNLIGDRWSLLIIRDAFDGITRFRDFQHNLGVARNILSDRLRKLVDADILEMRNASDGTAYQEYVLTKVGEDLFTILIALRQWGELHLFTQDEQHSIMVDQQTGKQIAMMQPMTQDGKVLYPNTALVKKIIQESEQ